MRRLGGLLATGLLLAVLVGGSATGVGGPPARGAAALPIKPPPFADGRLMNPLPDDFLFKVVSEGAGSVGLAPQMPAFRPPLTDRQIRDVIGYVRTFAQPPYQPPPPAAPVGPGAPPPAPPIEVR